MIFMVQSVQITLKKWENALVNYGKLDQWNISDDYLVLGRYIASKASRNSKTAIQEVRDYAIMANFNSELLLQKVRNANKVIKALNKSQFGNNIPTSESVGQAKRFEGTTKGYFMRNSVSKEVRNSDQLILRLRMDIPLAKYAELWKRECARLITSRINLTQKREIKTAII